MSNQMHPCIVCSRGISYSRSDKKTCSGKCRAALARRKKTAELVVFRIGNDLETLVSAYQMGAIDDEFARRIAVYVEQKLDVLKVEVKFKGFEKLLAVHPE